MKRLILLFLSALITACYSRKQISSSHFPEFTPPGTMALDSNFYCDLNEITNIDWREYTSWTGSVFGRESEEYLRTLPDTSTWLSIDSCLEPLSKHYHSHPAYHYYPVVGVSQEQAREYSKWRSDRVMESYLVSHKLIKIDTAPKPTTHFTIERYYSDKLTTNLTDQKLPYYPSYRLPSDEEALMAMHAADSIHAIQIAKCLTEKCNQQELIYARIVCETDTCTHTSPQTINVPIQVSSLDYYKSKRPRLLDLRGNVREWTDVEGIARGGGWVDQATRIAEADTFSTPGCNAYTGFRNVCGWKKW